MHSRISHSPTSFFSMAMVHLGAALVDLIEVGDDSIPCYYCVAKHELDGDGGERKEWHRL